MDRCELVQRYVGATEMPTTRTHPRTDEHAVVWHTHTAPTAQTMCMCVVISQTCLRFHEYTVRALALQRLRCVLATGVAIVGRMESVSPF